MTAARVAGTARRARHGQAARHQYPCVRGRLYPPALGDDGTRRRQRPFPSFARSALVVAAGGKPVAAPEIPITASFDRRVRDALRYYVAVHLQCWRFPYYRSHRKGWLIAEGLGWLLKFARQRFQRGRTTHALERIDRTRFFLFPLQLNTDFQIRTHSPFHDMYDAALYVLESFAHYAPDETMLVVKEHPLACQFRSWHGFLGKHARRLGIADRVIHVAGGDLNRMAHESLGLVTVNSTSGTLGLRAGRPVFVLGSAIYDIEGITHQGRLDDFWAAPHAPDMDVYRAFERVLHARCLVPGGLASESAVATLIRSTLMRLFNHPAHLPVQVGMGQTNAVHAAAEAAGSSVTPAASTGA